MSKENILIFQDTLKQIEESYPIDASKVRYYITLNTLDHSKGKLTPITMEHNGTVHSGYNTANEMRTAILNFANAVTPGGCVEYGSNAQEENICRCTNLFPHLLLEKSAKNYYTPNAEHEKTEPGIYTDRIIYTRDAIVFKDDETYENIEPRTLDIITCPAPSVYLTLCEAVPLYVMRIKNIVLSAIENKAECIVLGAWGCGAFGQDPLLVADAFAMVLNWYGGYFKKIVFAIHPTPTHQDDMYNTFLTRLSANYKGGINREK